MKEMVHRMMVLTDCLFIVLMFTIGVALRGMCMGMLL